MKLEDKELLQDFLSSDYYKPMKALFEECKLSLHADLINYTVETETGAFKMVQLKSRIEGATKLMALVDAQLGAIKRPQKRKP